MKHIPSIFRRPAAALAVLLMAAMAGCVFEPSLPEPELPQVGGEGREAVIKLNVPGMKTPSTRALDGDKEKEVRELDVVIFDASVTPPALLEYHRVTDFSQAGGDWSMKIKGIENSLDVTVAVIANASVEVASALAAVSSNGSYAGASKADFLLALSYSHGMKWNTSAADYMAIPMYGEATFASIYASLSNEIKLTRMVSKVDVVNEAAPTNPASPAAGDFELTTVYVINYNTKGAVAPMWDGATGELVTQGEPLLPNLPVGFDAGKRAWVEGNEFSYGLASGQTSVEGEIYLFESMAGYRAGENVKEPNAAPHNGTRLVVEGNWTDADGNTATYYYPVDFTYAGDTKYMPLLRNYRYVVTITAAEGKGYTRLADAAASYTVMSNLKTRVIFYDEGVIRNALFDGQYMLGVDETVLTFSKEAQQAVVNLFADNPSGWKAEVIDAGANEWLRFAGGLTEVKGTSADTGFTLAVEAFDPTAQEPQTRTAVIGITAGRLNMTVTVTQGANSKYWIKVTDLATGEEISGVSFNSKNSLLNIDPAPRKVVVEWSPADETVTVSRQAGSNDLTWTSAYDTALTGGIYVLTIDPAAFTAADVASPNEFLSKTSGLTFALGSTGQNRSLSVSQTHYQLIATDFADLAATVFSGEGNVKSNAPWSCTWTANMTGGITSPSTQPLTSTANPSGAPFPYTFASGSDGYVTFTFASADEAKAFDPVNVRVNAALLPSIPMISDAGTMIHNLYSYVGAFWRANEKGERLIRIPASRDASVVGKWAVQVYDYGKDFSEGDIVFSTAGTSDTGVIWDSETKTWDSGKTQTHTNPDAGGFYVTDGKTYAMGRTESTSDYIEFRVGLTSTFAPTTAKPARYATIIISYGSGNYNYHQKLYLRQGEGDDYVMYTGDRDAYGNAFTGGRTDARKWSPYSLTVKSWITIGENVDEESVQVNKRTASGDPFYETGTTYGTDEPDFAAYPTMVGAMFQWAQEVDAAGQQWQRRAFNPGLATYTNWSEGPNTDSCGEWVWDDELHETCPEGYRRPNIKIKNDGVAGNETWQSFGNFYSDTKRNSAYGYYADGYFDRLQVENADGPNGTNLSVVAKGGKDAACIGRIVFNNSPSSATHYNASLFIPASGFRRSNSGELQSVGGAGYGWSRLDNSGSLNNGCTYSVSSGAVSYYGSYVKSTGFPVRCVVVE